MHPSLLILLIGFLYIAAFGGLSYLRRQGLSLRFALEGLLITAIAAGLVLVTVPVNPFIFFVVLYLATMRVRLLVDLGNMFLSRKQYDRALAIYRFALGLAPDTTDRRLVLINRGATQLRMQEPEAARLTLEEALAGDPARVGAKHLAAGYYNLGVACQRTGREAEAIRLFHQVMDILPNSIYSKAAQEALKRGPAGKPD
jgi:tetratricopeptide (TPR) repeat protein